MHLFTLDQNGSLKLAEIPKETKSYTLNILLFISDELIDELVVEVQVNAQEDVDFTDADTSDSAYHETAPDDS